MDGGGSARGTRAVVIALVASTLAAAACLVAGDHTGSLAVRAVGVLAAVTAGHLLLVLVGVQRSRPDAGAARRRRGQEDGIAPRDRPEVGGHGREHHYWAFVLGAAGFAVAAGAVLARGADEVASPAPVSDLPWAAAALGATGIAALVWLRCAARAADEVRGRAGWWAFLRRARSPELPVALVEGGALLLTAVAAGGALAAVRATDDAGADGVGALVVGGVSALVAASLVAGVRELLIGRSGTGREVEVLEAAIRVDPSVERMLLLRTQHVGPDDLLVTTKVQLDHELSLPEVAEVIQRIERHVRAAVPAVRTMFIEPDVAVGRRAAPVVVDEHEPGHEVPDDARARLETERRRGALGEGIPLEADHEDPDGAHRAGHEPG